jgi:hypothetical protein
MECDFDCQRKKELDRLSQEMINAIASKNTEPEKYEQAKVAYMTYKNGEEWAATDREKKANEEVQPILDSFQRRFDAIKMMLMKNAAMHQAKQDIMNSQVGDEDESRFIHSEIEKEKNEASVAQRLKELGGVPNDVYAWLPIFLEMIIGLLILYVVFQIVILGKIGRIFGFNSQSPG